VDGYAVHAVIRSGADVVHEFVAANNRRVDGKPSISPPD